MDDKLTRVVFSSKKILELGFKFKYNLEDMYVGAVETCRAKGLIPLASAKPVVKELNGVANGNYVAEQKIVA